MKNKSIELITATIMAVLVLGSAGCQSSSSTKYSQSTGEKWDDKQVVRNIKHDLKENTLTKNVDIEVSSFRGNVALNGFVDHPMQKQEAFSIARSNAGVQSVHNNLIVKDTLPTGGNASGATTTEPAGAQTGH